MLALTWGASKMGARLSLVCGVVGGLLSSMYGGWTPALSVLLYLVIGDYVSGLIASVIDGTGLSSRVGFKGIAKKVAIFFLVLVAHKLDVAMGVRILMSVVVYFYVANELISVIENLGRIGVPIPKQWIQVIKVLKEK